MDETLPISVCMIVRDEANRLPGALASVRPYVREIVVVDTGSSDGSVAIARALGATVLQIAWQDDFSLARNVALQAARQDWILTLDADQRLDVVSVPALRAAVTANCDAQRVSIELVAHAEATEKLGGYSALRLFRRDPRIFYMGRVHEDVAGSLLAMGSSHWPEAGIVLRDFGYGDAGERQRKRERNVALLRRALAEQPDDLYAAYKLAISLPKEPHETPAAVLRDAMARARRLSLTHLQGLTFLPKLLAAAVEALVSQGRLCEAADTALALLPATGASGCFTAGRALARNGEAARATVLLTQFVTHATGDGSVAPGWSHDAAIDPDPQATVSEACCWLAWLAREAGDLPAAHHWLRLAAQDAQARADAPMQVRVACEAMRVMLAEGRMDAVARGLDGLHVLAQGSAQARAEVLLISAELASAIGDTQSALFIAQAAVTPDDDRASALVARLEMNRGGLGSARLYQLLAQVRGRRYDTLAVRLMLAHQLGTPVTFLVPQAAELELNGSS